MRLEQITANALKQVDNNRYLLTAGVAKRVEQLLNGAETKLDRDTSKEEPSNIAIEEPDVNESLGWTVPLHTSVEDLYLPQNSPLLLQRMVSRAIQIHHQKTLKVLQQ